MAQWSLILLGTIILWINITTAEYRKLIPKCSNSCLANGRATSSNCFCDSKCALIYNDCCLDATYRTIRASVKRRHNIHCVFVHGENKHFWMVDTCKESWSGHDHIRQKCMDTSAVSGDTNNIVAALPVTNPDEGVTYKNYYCALCHDENAEELVEWRIKALCPNRDVDQQDVLQNLTFVEEEKQWGVWKLAADDEWTFHECFLLFERPVGVTDGIRHCVSGMVSTCPPSWKNISVRRKCKSYVDPVKWPDGLVYKNMDCATCHNITNGNFQCIYDVTSGSSSAMLSLAMPVDLNSMGQWF